MLSHHPKTRNIKDKKELKKWATLVQWMDLTVLKAIDGQPNDESGYVEFRALYSEKGMLCQIHENSFFKKHNSKWVYVSGVHIGD